MKPFLHFVNTSWFEVKHTGLADFKEAFISQDYEQFLRENLIIDKSKIENEIKKLENKVSSLVKIKQSRRGSEQHNMLASLNGKKKSENNQKDKQSNEKEMITKLLRRMAIKQYKNDQNMRKSDSSKLIEDSLVSQELNSFADSALILIHPKT